MTERRPLRVAVCAIVLALIAPVGTWGAAQTREDLPTLADQPVNDLAHVIDPASAAEIDRRSRALKQASGDVVMVVTVDTIAQIQSHLLAHQYGDLIKKAKLKGRLR